MEKLFSVFNRLALSISALAIIAAAFILFYQPQENVKVLAGGVVQNSTGIDSSLVIKAGLTFNHTGKHLFKNNCAQCHSVTDVVVGPALSGIEKRRKKEWLYKFVTNSQAVIKSGDPYANELFNKFNKTEMPTFALQNAEIDSILSYIQYESVLRGK